MNSKRILHLTRNSVPFFFMFPTNAPNFNVKPGTVQLLPKFHGLESKKSYLHMKEFEADVGHSKTLLNYLS